MPIPQRPPLIASLAADLGDMGANAAFQTAMAEPMDGGKYLHWDDLRLMTPPGALTHEQWWLALKLARRGGRVALPLTDNAGRAFSLVVPDHAQQRLHELSMGLGGRMAMAERVANKEARDRYYVSSLIQEAITSSQFEGATTTRIVAEEMLRTGRKPIDKSERMIRNNFAAMKLIDSMKNTPLTPGAVLALHRVIIDGTLDAGQSGRLRGPDEHVQIMDVGSGEIHHDPPPSDQLEGRLADMCRFANGETPGRFVHPIARAILLHFWLACDHPFVDGNGRTARALFYWLMAREGYWLCEFISISSVILRAREAYERAFLYAQTDDGDATYFLVHQLNALKQAMDSLHEYIRHREEAAASISAHLRGMADLNHRQRELITHALRHPVQRYTVASHRNSHNTAYDTARNDLLDLKKRGLLKMAKQGKEFVFVAAKDLERRLAKR